MSIQVRKNVFRIDTDKTTYAFCLQNDELIHLYYGQKIAETDDLQYLVSDNVRSFAPYRKEVGNSFTKDNLLAEISFADTGDFRICSADIMHENGQAINTFVFKKYEIIDGREKLIGLPSGRAGKGVQTLFVTLSDVKTGVEVVLTYVVYPHKDVIIRYTTVRNVLEEKIYIGKLCSAVIDVEDGADYKALTLQGVVANERHAVENPLPMGRYCISSCKGASGHAASPFMIIAENATTESNGGAYAINLVYSGNFKMETEKTACGRLRFTAGLNDENFRFGVEANEQFVSPEAILTYSDCGYNGISKNNASYIQDCLMPVAFVGKSRPIVANTWEAYFFDFNEEKLLQFAETAKETGIDTLVIDDGWFSSRRDDFSGLGDWTVSEKVFSGGKQGLQAFVKKVHSMGLNVGIWIEPEMVNPDSELFRAHPEWALGASDNIQSRNQLVLDMTNPKVREYIFKSLCAVLDGTGFTYVKWDMNRYICPFQSTYTAERGEISHRYILGVYELLERFCERYPNIVLETCAGGGGRYDAGMLAYSSMIWTSDNTDPFERCYIQCGTSYAYPVVAMSCHVTKSRNGGTKLDTDSAFRYGVATNGVLGYELDILRLSQTEKEEMRRQIADYREKEYFLLNGDFYRLRVPFKDGKYYAYAMISKDKKEALIAFHTLSHFLADGEIVLKIDGLNDNLLYKTDCGVLSGKALRCAGIKIPLPNQSGESYRCVLKSL